MSKIGLPEKIGKYVVEKILGHGGMGTVYLCHDPDLQRQVAVKILNLRKSPKGSNAQARRLRFLREALTTAQLQHPGIPPVYDVQELPGNQAYYVMKPIDGKPLQDILNKLREGDQKAREEFDLFRLIEILRDVCQALQYAHNCGYIHRDLKPSNIFVGDFGEVYLIDWGLTKAIKDISNRTFHLPKHAPEPEFDVSPDNATQTVSLTDSELESEPVDLSGDLTLQGDILGTLAYMPPEQASGSTANLGFEVDVYALGVILYEMLTLELPVEGATFKEILRQKVKGEIVSPEMRAASREIPPELSAITMQSMNPAPEERFKSAKEFNEALEFWLEGKSQWRGAACNSFEKTDFHVLPKAAVKLWKISKDTVATVAPKPEKPCYFVFNREYTGDIRFAVNFVPYPISDDGATISEFALFINGYAPRPWNGLLDCYSIRLGCGNNTRAILCKNDTEVVSNEYVVLEPRKRYRLTVERISSDIRVILNRQAILVYRDTDPLTGLHVGFAHLGENVVYSGVRIQSRGMPTTTASINVPEALLLEGCYEGALKRFMMIARAHKNRYEGAWARYRAGIASYRLDKNSRTAQKIWAPLKSGPYAVFEQLGRAMLQMESNHPFQAADILLKMLRENETIPHLDPVADMAFTQAQQLLRQEPGSLREWRICDAWARVTLILGSRLESKESMTPSILWRWILLTLTGFPQQLPDCIVFLRETFGKGKGVFAETLTTIDPLLNVLRRSADMSDHAFLVDRVMRLILNHDDNLGNLETLMRFYLHSGHETVARRISLHIYWLCRKRGLDLPPAPAAFLCLLSWLHGENNAQELIDALVDHSSEWAKADGKLLQGLEKYAKGDSAGAWRVWCASCDDANSISFNRHLIARGMMGMLPADPVEADVPNRSDHRLLYCLFLGYRFFLDWKNTGKEDVRRISIRLLDMALGLVRPSYDIYSATESFARIPLEMMGYPTPPRAEPAPLSEEEETWLKKLTVAASKEAHDVSRRTSTHHRRSSSLREHQSDRSNPRPDKRKS